MMDDWHLPCDSAKLPEIVSSPATRSALPPVSRGGALRPGCRAPSRAALEILNARSSSSFLDSCFIRAGLAIGARDVEGSCAILDAALLGQVVERQPCWETVGQLTRISPDVVDPSQAASCGRSRLPLLAPTKTGFAPAWSHIRTTWAMSAPEQLIDRSQSRVMGVLGRGRGRSPDGDPPRR